MDVLLGRALLPERPVEDEFFAADRAVRDGIWGGYDRDGDGTDDPAPLPTGISAGPDDVTTPAGTLDVLRRTLAARAEAGQPQGPYSARSFTYHLHQPPDCSAERTMDRTDRAGDADGCAVGDTLSSAAPYLPTAAHPATDTLGEPLASGSKVRAELYVKTRAPAALVAPSVVLLATDREIGRGKATAQPVTGAWTKLTIEFATARHAFTGEQLTVQLLSDTTALLVVGYEGDHATRLSLDPAPLPPSGLAFGATIASPADGTEVTEGETVMAGGRFAFPDAGTDPEGVGGRPETHRVQLSVDDEGFAVPISAQLDEATGTWRAKAGRLPVGDHVLYARAVRDGTPSPVTRTAFRVTPDARVEWQVVSRNAPVDTAAWRPAAGLADWSFALTTSSYGAGHRTIVVRLVERGTETARTTARARFR
ncbi:hypothetical protein ACFPM3_17905 [Streptomyces coeruleoprunus]|uniref:Uncharacterized protein n=1 Tax=Streptomyces coeruleoprunus TaxID=285563 RepID=A0ABV9XG91_9ACTN